MRSARTPGVLAFATIATVGALLHCGSVEEPTQIVVEVSTNDCTGVVSTVVRVNTLDDYSLGVSATSEKCDPKTKRIGRFVLVPRQATDAEVRFQVVTGINTNAESCKSADAPDCVVASVITNYRKNETVTESVLMDAVCKGKQKDCKPGETCKGGVCVPIQSPGCPPSCPSTDGGTDAPADVAAPSLCEKVCKGLATGGTAKCLPDGTCEIRCEGGATCGDITCPPGLSCDVGCSGAGACGKVTCAGPACTTTCGASACTQGPECSGGGKCTIACNGVSACRGSRVTCTAAECDVTCSGSNNDNRACDGNVTVAPNGQRGTVRCVNPGGQRNPCGDLACGDRGCDCPNGDPRSCFGGGGACGTCSTGGPGPGG